MAAVYMVLSAVLLAVGVGLTAWGRPRLGAGLILAAAMVRQGIIPFHAWVPEIFEHGRIGPAVMFCAPGLGTYAALVLAVPQASKGLLGAVSVLALMTALIAPSSLSFSRTRAGPAATCS